MNTETEVQLTYGEFAMIKLEELLGDIYGEKRAALPVGGDFWEWRKENKTRAGVLNKAGLVLNKAETKNGYSQWTADVSKVTADSLDEARDSAIAWKRTEKEIKERARIYLRQCDRAKYQPGGQFGGAACSENCEPLAHALEGGPMCVHCAKSWDDCTCRAHRHQP